MSTSTAEPSSSTGSTIDITIRAPGDKKHPIKIDPTQSVGELKALVAEASGIEADRQRLIYSGRVLKDEEKVETYKIRSGDTVHLVKGASKTPNPPPSAQVPESISTGGQIAGNPLAPLMNATNAPYIGNFNPFADMGMNPNDPNMMQSMMNSPEGQAQMRAALSNPDVINQIIDSSPELRQMGPQMRQMMQSEQFREILTNPQRMQEVMRQGEQMRSMFGGQMPGLGGFGGLGGGGTDPWGANLGGGAAGGQTQQQQRGPTNLFNPQPPQQQQPAGQTPAAGQAPQGAPDFAALANLFGAGGMGGGGGGNPFGGFGGFGGPGSPPPAAQPQDTRPPEERYATQLTQLQDMGFVNPSANIRALQAAGGNVQAAVEYILSQQSW